MEPTNDNLDRWIEKLRLGQCPSLSEVKAICAKGAEILGSEPNVLEVSSPVAVCGDVHGQFYDLIQLFQTGGDCPGTQYVFLGDYVDRGHFSLETFLLLLGLKVRHPSRITLIRGNHESRQVTQVYGFYDECLQRFGQPDAWRICTDVFDLLPLAVIIDGSILCIHGGISPQSSSVDGLRLIERRQEIPHEGEFTDIVWSDPDERAEGWEKNPRGAGFLFGKGAVQSFLRNNSLDLLTRSHQLVQEGYQWLFDESLITVWSAPNYCYRCGNQAALLEVGEGAARSLKTFGPMPEDLRRAPPKSALPEYFL